MPRRFLARIAPAALGVALLGVASVAAGFWSASAFASTRHAGRHNRRHATAARSNPYKARDPYAATAGKPNCRYPDGTPFDPDIIGGANHVGDGGPAVNLGGFPPCGY